MKDGAKEILGKTITGVVIKAGGMPPKSQLFLVFSDGTYYEFYCDRDHIHPTGGLWRGDIEDVRRYMGEVKNITFEVHAKSIARS